MLLLPRTVRLRCLSTSEALLKILPLVRSIEPHIVNSLPLDLLPRQAPRHTRLIQLAVIVQGFELDLARKYRGSQVGRLANRYLLCILQIQIDLTQVILLHRLLLGFPLF